MLRRGLVLVVVAVLRADTTAYAFDWASSLSLIGGQAADGYVTTTNIQSGCVESNTWMYGSPRPTIDRVIYTKVAITSGVWITAELLGRKGHGKISKFVKYFTGAHGAALALINGRQSCR